MKRTKSRNIYLIIAGVLNLFAALVHTIAGQIDLVNPLMDSNLNIQAKAEWLGVWHIATAMLFVSSYYLITYGLSKTKMNSEVIKLIGILYVFFAVAFIISSLYTKVFALQWTLLLPIGVLSLIGIKNAN